MTDPTFTIDGQAAPLAGWQADAEADWGDKVLTGRVPRTVLWAEQGSLVQAWRADGSLMWSGELSQDPRTEGDERLIRAEGFASRLAAAKERMFYRIDGSEDWTDEDSDPFDVEAPGNQKYEMVITPGAIRWRFGNNADAFATGDRLGVVIWIEGGLITRYSFLVQTSVSLANFNLLVQSFTGPSGGLTENGPHSLSIGSPTIYASNIASPEDALRIAVRASSATTPTGRRKVKITSLRVYGRTTNDAFSASDVVADVGGISGFDVSGVQSSSLAILPLDWTDDHPDLLSYMSNLLGWRWLVRGNDLRFGPFERTWRVDTSHDASADLEPERRYNRVRIPFRNLAGVLREAEASPAEDPFPGREFTWYGPELVDPQSNPTLASSAASLLVEHMASRRMSGQVRLGQVHGPTGTQSSYDAEAGDLLEMSDLLPDLPVQRIRSITYRPGEVTAGIGEPFDPLRIMADARGRGRRRRKGPIKTTSLGGPLG